MKMLRLLTCRAAPKQRRPPGLPRDSLRRERAARSSPLANSPSSCSSTCRRRSPTSDEQFEIPIAPKHGAAGRQHKPAYCIELFLIRSKQSQEEKLSKWERGMFFTAADYNFTSNIEFHRGIPAELGEDGDGAAKRRRALKLVDRALSKRQYKTALSLVKQLQGKPGGLRAFGAAKQITKGLSSVHEFELNGNNLLSLQPLVDSILDSIQQCTQISLLDEISAEKLESLIAGSGHSSRYEEEHLICAEHEAGHFLVGYLLGVLPREYEVPSIQTLSQNRFAEGKVSFVGFEFLGEIDSFKILSENADMRKFRNRAANNGRISLKTLKQFSCVTLGGLVAELLVAGNSDGHLADILKLESVLRWLGLSKANADLHLKWAATNTVFVLSRHCETRSRLAEAMALGKPIGICIDTIENCLQGREI